LSDKIVYKCDDLIAVLDVVQRRWCSSSACAAAGVILMPDIRPLLLAKKKAMYAKQAAQQTLDPASFDFTASMDIMMDRYADMPEDERDSLIRRDVDHAVKSVDINDVIRRAKEARKGDVVDDGNEM
jgi:hypothetical protein